MKAAAVSQNRAIPSHELVKTSQGLDHVITGAKMKMVGIAQFDLTTQLFLQVKGIDAAFNGSLRAHVHEHRRLDRAAVGAGKHTAPGLALFFDDLEHAISYQILHHKIPETQGKYHRKGGQSAQNRSGGDPSLCAPGRKKQYHRRNEGGRADHQREYQKMLHTPLNE